MIRAMCKPKRLELGFDSVFYHRNVGKVLPDCTVLQYRKQPSSSKDTSADGNCSICRNTFSAGSGHTRPLARESTKRSRTSQKNVLLKLFGPKDDEVASNLRKLRNEQHYRCD
jgi:hypothetical protein